MYWPTGTPRQFATSQSQTPTFNLVVSPDGLPPFPGHPLDDGSPFFAASKSPSPSAEDSGDLQRPVSPTTPLTPAINPVENERHENGNWGGLRSASVPLKDPILALRSARAGHIFATITATSITIWQAKPTVILVVVVRSDTSLKTYGTNVNLLLRPDASVLVVQTSLGYLITYSVATDGEPRVYKPHFPNRGQVQRRKQMHHGSPGSFAPEHFMWGPGEGSGARDVSVRFRVVIKVDAGIESTLALDDELLVSTTKPIAIQCIRWSPDKSGNQTKTELLSRMSWLVDKRVSIKEMTYDRPMGLLTWITDDGKAYAVQRLSHSRAQGSDADTESKKLFKGFCFHSPQGKHDHATRAVVNSRFSLIAVGCADGCIRVYNVKDYAGNIPPSHTYKPFVSATTSGALSTLVYSPDGYCLFAGYETGWTMWSVYGKSLWHSFGTNSDLTRSNEEDWLMGVREAVWFTGSCEILLVAEAHESIWLLELARSAVTGCYSSSNLCRTMLQSTSSIMVYRGYDLPDLTSISSEPFLWHTARIPNNYLWNQWPTKCAVISPDGRYVAVAGRRGLAHYSVNSGRWKTFANDEAENEFQVRGGMCWYQNVLVAAVEVQRSYELRLYSREAALDSNAALVTHKLTSPVVLLTPSGEDSLLVYTYDNFLYHFIFADNHGNGISLVHMGQIGFHGIVRSPARVRGLSWILPDSQLQDGDPSMDVSVASVLFLVDGKLVLLQPSTNNEGQMKYEMRTVLQNVEYYTCMKDFPLINLVNSYQPGQGQSSHLSPTGTDGNLQNSLWVFDGNELKVWRDVRMIAGDQTIQLPPHASVSFDFYPLSALLEKGLVLGVEPELIQRKDVPFSYFRFQLRTHPFIPYILRFYLSHNMKDQARFLARQYEHLTYFAHALEILLHNVLDDEADKKPSPDTAIMPRVLDLLSNFKQYHNIVVQCTRKTEVRSWRTLFDYLPLPQDLFEENLRRGELKTAGGYLLILHELEESEIASEQSVRLLQTAMRAGDWDLCKELARFLAAMDGKGDILRDAMKQVNIAVPSAGGDESSLASRLTVPSPRKSSGARSIEQAVTGLGLSLGEPDAQSYVSDAASDRSGESTPESRNLTS